MNPSSTLQYFKKPFFWKLGYLKINKKAKIQSGVTGGEETEVNLATCIPLPEDTTDGPPSLTAFKGELDSAVSQYISQVKDLGYKEETPKDQKLLAVKFQLDPDDIKPKSEEEEEEEDEFEEEKPKIKVISKEDKCEQTELEVEVTSVDNPLYLTLSECSSGLLPYSEQDLPQHHHYENGQVGREDEHIYENVDNSTGGEEEEDEEEHLYDTLPRRKPDLPPKPDFLSQLAARQSEPVKRAWNPFVSLSVDTGDPTPPLSTASSLSSPDSHLTNEHSEVSPQKEAENTTTNPFLDTKPTETSEQTLILDGSETSDLGSSGGEYDVGSVEDWPLPPTPPPGEEEVTVQDDPLPPPPPELALQQLEEEVFREEQEERKVALQKEKESIAREYGAKTKDLDEAQQVEAVNTTLTSLEEKFTKPDTQTPPQEPEPKKEPKIIQIDEDDSDEFDTPAIRHSVIIELKDSCPNVPQSLRPSEIRRKESLKRSESVKHTSVLRRTNSYNKVNRRESLCKVFPSITSEFKKSENGESVSVGVTSPKREEQSFTFLDSGASKEKQFIEISDDGSWETKLSSMDSLTNNHNNKQDIDPFTGNPIMAPPLSPVAIAAPPTEFQTDDGMDGVYCANVINTHSGPSSLASTFADSLGAGDVNSPETPSFMTAPETILEEPPSFFQDPAVMDLDEKAADSAQTNPAEDMEVRSPVHKNLGVAIMEGYEQDLQKKKDSMNLPEHSLLEFGDTVRDLEQQRRSVIKQMTVKAKRKDTWIKTFNMHAHGNGDNIPVAPSRARRKNSPQRPETVTRQDISDLPVNGFAKKSEPGIVKLQKSSLEASPSQNMSPKSTKTPGKVEPVPPPKSSRKNKMTVEPVVIAPVKIDNSQTVPEESVISPKNTEILAALFSSPVKTAQNIEEHKVSPQSSPKKMTNSVKPETDAKVTHDIPAVEPAGDSAVVDQLVSFADSPVKRPAAPAPPVTSTKPEDFLVMSLESTPVFTAATPVLSPVKPSEESFTPTGTTQEER
ncbi:uncharacterized protein LOC121870208 [Homarus americanus]|uniref:uncharacterized protein LOC121870208 n=1 Tax=Homarus americanus TaxID=6706 RepID=UPI001C484BD3|nr:uncharacterized protein LOC121870208 [Homarus americanus]